VIALSNANNSGVGGIVRNIVNILYHQPLARSFAQQPVIQLTERVKKEYTGIYKFRKEDTVQATVYLKDSSLFMTLGNQPAFEILPVFKDVFKAGEARIEFRRNKEQRISEIWLFNKGELAQVSKMD
jgi:hypothetical protein